MDYFETQTAQSILFIIFYIYIISLVFLCSGRIYTFKFYKILYEYILLKTQESLK